MSVLRPDIIKDQVALVTGGATGIGKEICRTLGAHGAAGHASGLGQRLRRP